MSELTWRQEEQFQDTCDIVNIVTNPNTDGHGTPSDDSYSVVTVGIRYEHNPTPNLDVATVAGRQLVPKITTTDQATFAIGHGPQDANCIINRTILPDGSKGPYWGKGFRILGMGRAVPTLGIREANEVIYDLRILDHNPSPSFGWPSS